jgi:hypothetical protein
MPLVLPCPHCQRTVELPEQEAGKVVRCPECQAAFETPPAALPMLDENGPARRVSTTGIPMSAWQALTDNSASVDDEPRPTRGAYPAPPRPHRAEWEAVAPVSSGHPPLESGWGRVSSGLGFISVLTLGFLGLSYLTTCIGLISGEGGAVASLFLGGITLVGMLLGLLALSDVCAMPAQSGVRSLTHATAWTALAGFILLGLGLLLLLVSSLSRPSYSYGYGSRSDPFLYAAISTMVFLLAAMLLLLSYVLFVFVLRGVALFFGDHKLAQNILIFFFCSIAIPIAAIIILFCLISTMSYRDSERIGAMIALLVVLVVNTIVLLWFFNLLRDVRYRIDNVRRNGETA